MPFQLMTAMPKQNKAVVNARQYPQSNLVCFYILNIVKLLTSHNQANSSANCPIQKDFMHSY